MCGCHVLIKSYLLTYLLTYLLSGLSLWLGFRLIIVDRHKYHALRCITTVIAQRKTDYSARTRLYRILVVVCTAN